MGKVEGKEARSEVHETEKQKGEIDNTYCMYEQLRGQKKEVERKTIKRKKQETEEWKIMKNKS